MIFTAKGQLVGMKAKEQLVGIHDSCSPWDSRLMCSLGFTADVLLGVHDACAPLGSRLVCSWLGFAAEAHLVRLHSGGAPCVAFRNAGYLVRDVRPDHREVAQLPAVHVVADDVAVHRHLPLQVPQGQEAVRHVPRAPIHHRVPRRGVQVAQGGGQQRRRGREAAHAAEYQVPGAGEVQKVLQVKKRRKWERQGEMCARDRRGGVMARGGS